jgi:protein TonB
MFEDSTFESNGRIRTRSRVWMAAAFAFNASLLLALILIPLIYPEALPRQFATFLMAAPVFEPEPQPVPAQPAHPFEGAPQISDGHIYAPSRIPDSIKILLRPEGPPPSATAAWDQEAALSDNQANLFRGHGGPVVVRREPSGPVRVPSTIVAGMILQKTMPVYPPIAVAARQQGTVTLHAVISKTGAIENLRVASGPAMLQQAAVDAVRTWRYRPYLLNGEPVEVETEVNVVFTLQR